MAATNETQIWDLISPMEKAVATLLTAANVPTVMIPRSNETLPESRVEIMFVPGEAANVNTLSDGRKVYDYFTNGELRIKIITFRPDQQSSLLTGVRDLHAEFAGEVGKALDESGCPFDGLLPFHYVNTIRPTRPFRDFDSQFMEDYTELVYAIDYGVKETAWIVSS